MTSNIYPILTEDSYKKINNYNHWLTQIQNTKESYKRIDHFNEWISQIQGHKVDIPEEIFERIVLEIKKEPILDNSKLTYSKMREILKKLKINKYYEHVYYITNCINGQFTSHFTPDIEEKLRTMFKEIQEPFLKHYKGRQSFFPYHYILYKFLQLLKEHTLLEIVPLIKSKEKLQLLDSKWSTICKELNWQYIAST